MRAVPCAHIADYYDQCQQQKPSIGNNMLRRGYREWANGQVPYGPIWQFCLQPNNLYGIG